MLFEVWVRRGVRGMYGDGLNKPLDKKQLALDLNDILIPTEIYHYDWSPQTRSLDLGIRTNIPL